MLKNFHRLSVFFFVMFVTFLSSSCRESPFLSEKNPVAANQSSQDSENIPENHGAQSHSLEKNSLNQNPISESPTSSARMKSFWDQMGASFSKLSNYVKNLGTRSLGYCARSIRKMLNILTGKNVDNGPSACRYDVHHLNRMFRKPGYKWVQVDATPSSIQEGDVVVCNRQGGCIPRAGLHGHIELALASSSGAAQFVSDFRQNQSLCFSNPRRYAQPPRVYRAVPDSASAQQDFHLDFLIFPKAWANAAHSDRKTEKENDGVSPDPNLNKTYQAEVLGPLQGYQMIVYEPPLDGAEGAYYEILQLQNQNKKSLIKSYVSAFDAIRKISDKKTQRLFAKSYVELWIKKDGRKNVQTTILNLKTIDPLAKESFLDLGFKLPRKYEIYPLPESN